MVGRRLYFRMAIAEDVGSISTKEVDVLATINVGHSPAAGRSDEAGEHTSASHVGAASEVHTPTRKHLVGTAP